MENNLNVRFVAQGSSFLASHRMRVTKPAELLNVGVDNIDATVGNQANPDVDVNIFHKHFTPHENYRAVLQGEVLGYYTIFDVCDDHFDRELGQYYTDMCQKVDHITCNSANMQERIYEVVGRLARIIPDPITFPKGEVFIREGKEPNLIWIGHSRS